MTNCMGQGTVPCPAVLSLSAINGTRNRHLSHMSYTDDSVSVGRRGFLGIHLFDAVEISLNPSSFSVPQYNYLFGGE